MGAPRGVGEMNEQPPHAVSVGAFCIDVTEVTGAAYRACVRSGGCTPAFTTMSKDDSAGIFFGRFCHGERPEYDDHPINCVDWKQADAYCRHGGGRLPTEAQWEYAARGTDGRAYPWGDEPPGPRRGNACGSECRAMGERAGRRGWVVSFEGDDGAETTAPVGSYPEGRSPFGLLDMSGNVWEVVTDWYASYKRSDAPLVDPTGPDGPVDGNGHIRRGGGWGEDVRVRATTRDTSHDWWERDPALGFRCAHAPL
jgi:formylglycine-generating enzyme required for sulfatase activity